MQERVATCACGALGLETRGAPLSVSICHCLDCQRRTGSAFGVQARFARSQVEVRGEPKTYTRTGDSGGAVTFSFCEGCGSTVFWTPDGLPEFVMVAVGAFADPSFPAPERTVYEARRHAWAGFEDLDLDRME